MSTNTSELQERSNGSRYVSLDGMRGVASLIVVFYHYSIMFDIPKRWYLLPLFTGEAAVLLFFILSGFVLSVPFWNKGTTGPYDSYFTRRFFRIFVPLFFARVVALVCDAAFGRGHLPLNSWYYLTWQDPVTPKFVMKELLYDTGPRLNTAFWSLRYEIVLSIFFPLILLMIRKLKPAESFCVIVVVYMLGADILPIMTRDVQLYQETIRYGSMFLLGALIAQERQQLRKLFDRTHAVTKTGLLFLSMACYGDAAKSFLRRDLIPYLREPIMVAGAAGLILLALFFSEFQDILKTAVPTYLGRISYSLYLIHGTMLFALTNVLYWKLSPGAIFVVYIVSSFGVAHLFCATIEEPFLRVGKRLGSAVRSIRWHFVVGSHGTLGT